MTNPLVLPPPLDSVCNRNMGTKGSEHRSCVKVDLAVWRSQSIIVTE